jgi:hypothetical protein
MAIKKPEWKTYTVTKQVTHFTYVQALSVEGAVTTAQIEADKLDWGVVTGSVVYKAKADKSEPTQE